MIFLCQVKKKDSKKKPSLFDTTGKIVIETSNALCDDVFCADRVDCSPGEYVLPTVSDNGHGIGLGLATVYGIVKQNSGFVEVNSFPQSGTSFKIYLPRHEEDRTERSDETHDFRGGKETILIAEDDESVLNLGREMLESLGDNVLTAGSARHAIQPADQYPKNIDLLLTDVVMPHMNGKELTQRICALRPGLRCLYMSGYTADVIARQGILAEGIHFIPKPFTIRDLALKIREVLEQ